MQGIGIKDNSKHQPVPALLEALLNLEWNVVDDAKKLASNKTRRVIRKPSLRGRQRDRGVSWSCFSAWQLLLRHAKDGTWGPGNLLSR